MIKNRQQGRHSDLSTKVKQPLRRVPTIYYHGEFCFHSNIDECDQSRPLKNTTPLPCLHTVNRVPRNTPGNTLPICIVLVHTLAPLRTWRSWNRSWIRNMADRSDLISLHLGLRYFLRNNLKDCKQIPPMAAHGATVSSDRHLMFVERLGCRSVNQAVVGSNSGEGTALYLWPGYFKIHSSG
jgi:hypothetical protein